MLVSRERRPQADAARFFPRSYALDDASHRDSFVEDFRRTACAAACKAYGRTPAPADADFVATCARVVEAWVADLRGEEEVDPVVLDDRRWTAVLDYVVAATTDEAPAAAAALPTPPASRRPTSARPAAGRPRSARPRSARPTSARPVAGSGYRGVRELAAAPAPVEERWRLDQSRDAALRGRCLEALGALETLWPQFGIDGSKNVWVVKAPEACRGRGIVLHRRLDEILTLADRFPGRVAQKYVEETMLWDRAGVDVKFDLRCWALLVGGGTAPLEAYAHDPLYFRRRGISLRRGIAAFGR